MEEIGMKQGLTVALVTAFSGVVMLADGVTAQQPAPAPSLAGAYTLAQVNEAELPAPLSEEGGCRREITAATLTLQPGDKWTLDATIQETCGETVANKKAMQSGSYTANATALEFKATAPAAGAGETAEGSKDTIKLQPISAGTVNDNAITVKQGDKSLVFKR
jgi:hypothetical protein